MNLVRKSVFSWLMRVYVGFIMLVTCTSSRFPCFLLVSGVWGISSGIGLCFPFAKGLCKFYGNAGGKQPIQRQLLLVQHKHQVNPLLLIHNYTPPKRISKWPRPLFRPTTNHTCHQNPNPCRETVPLNKFYQIKDK